MVSREIESPEVERSLNDGTGDPAGRMIVDVYAIPSFFESPAK